MNRIMILTGLLFLIGAGCSQVSTDVSIDQNGQMDNPVQEETTEVSESTPVPLAELSVNILDGKAQYREYRYTHESGTCAEAGAPATISYRLDEDRGYFIVDSADSAYIEASAMGTAANTVSFDEVPLTQGEAKCTIKVSFGQSTGTYICTVDEKEVCSSTVSAVAIPL